MAEWEAYSMIEPFGERHQDLRFGMLQCLIANVNRDSKKHSAPYRPDQFLPPNYETYSAQKEKKASDTKVLNIFRMLRDQLRRKK